MGLPADTPFEIEVEGAGRGWKYEEIGEEFDV